MIFDKMQSLGNDFVIVEKSEFVKDDIYTSSDIKHVCDRNYGIGCDTLINYSINKDNRTVLCEFYNSNGTKAEVCGNGLRCLGLLLSARYDLYDFSAQYFTRKQLLTTKVHYDEDNEIVYVNMGVPMFDAKMLTIKPDEIPTDFLNIGNELEPYLWKKFDVACVSVGNPHVVFFSPIKDKEFVGKTLNNRKYFRNGINVSFAKVIDKHTINLQVYERGCGFTLACGSGACATAYLAMKKGFVDSSVIVKQNGGDLMISLEDDGSITHAGVAEYVFLGDIALA